MHTKQTQNQVFDQASPLPWAPSCPKLVISYWKFEPEGFRNAPKKGAQTDSSESLWAMLVLRWCPHRFRMISGIPLWGQQCSKSHSEPFVGSTFSVQDLYSKVMIKDCTITVKFKDTDLEDLEFSIKKETGFVEIVKG